MIFLIKPSISHPKTDILALASKGPYKYRPSTTILLLFVKEISFVTFDEGTSITLFNPDKHHKVPKAPFLCNYMKEICLYNYTFYPLSIYRPIYFFTSHVDIYK